MSRMLILWLLIVSPLLSQTEGDNVYTFDVQGFSGTLARHNKNIAHLAVDHPQGLILSVNKRTFGAAYWQEAYGYPDVGVSFVFQDFGNVILGENYGLYGHYNFYFLDRSLMLRVAQGVAYNTNPYDPNSNFKNSAYGSHLLASSYVMLNYKRDRIFRGLGIQAGFTLVHHSNGGFRAPNSGTNVLALNLGLNYQLDDQISEEIQTETTSKDYSETIKFNLMLRGGINEGDYLRLGQHPFVVATAFLDKKINYKSTFQLGIEAFYSEFLRKEIEYVAIAFPSSELEGNEDFKRFSIFAGHELNLGYLSVPTQLGYYIYWPYEYESRVYSRVGVKKYLSKKWFCALTVKSHAFNAEAIEFGIGIRL